MLSTFSGLPRTAWVVFAGTVVNRLGYVVTPFLVFYLGSRGIATEEIPWVLGALGAGNLVGPAIGGLLADRVGRRFTMLVGLLGTATAQGLLFLAPSVATLALAAALLSTAGTVVSPAGSALMSDAIRPEQRRTAFSLLHWGVNLGTAVAGILGGFLAAHGYWLLFLLDGLTSLAFALIVTALLPADRGGKGKAEGGYAIVLRDPLMRRLLPLDAVALIIYSLSEVCLPLAMRDHGLSPATFGVMATLNAVLVVVLQPVATSVLARVPQMRVYVGSSLLIAAGMALTGVAQTPWAFAGTVVLWSVGEAAVGGIGGAIVASLAPPHARGRYQGSYQWTWGLARFAALSIGAAVYAVDPAYVWWFAAVGGVLSAVGMGLLGKRIAERAAALDAEPVPA